MMKNWVWIVTDAQTEQVTGMDILGTYDKLALIQRKQSSHNFIRIGRYLETTLLLISFMESLVHVLLMVMDPVIRKL